MIKSRIILILLFFLIFLSHHNTHACNEARLKNIESYLNSFETFSSSFKEYSDGTIKEGIIEIKKPEKIAVKYSFPEKISIFVNGNVVTHYNHELDEVTQVKQNIQALTFLSKSKIDIFKDLDNVKCGQKDNNITLIFSNPITENDEEVAIVFNEDCSIKSILTIKDGNLKTAIILSNTKKNINISNESFQPLENKFLKIEE